MVKLASRIVNAISLGVFCRDAPSTNAIILSKKLSPGSVVTRTLILSLNTLVPPVTEDLSPPDSRITGALSPVMALSSIVAMPSMISPSIGIVSPASQKNISPFLSADDETIFISPTNVSPTLKTFFAGVSCLVLRKLSACALPLASAMASAKLANKTVKNNIAVTVMLYAKLPCEVSPMAIHTQTPAIISVPISTVNIMGFFTM